MYTHTIRIFRGSELLNRINRGEKIDIYIEQLEKKIKGIVYLSILIMYVYILITWIYY